MDIATHLSYLAFIALAAGCVSGPTDVQRTQFSHLGVHRIPPTARTIGTFRRITPTMNMEHIVKLVGYPDALWGSGVYIYAYRLKDGTYVGIGHDGYEHVLYVQHGEEFIVNNMSNEQMNERGVPRTRGYVADAATAIRIAEAVCEPIYGVERLANQRPFHTSYTNGTWIVRGRRAASGQAEVLFVEIAERDGRVLKMGYDTNSY